MCLIDRRLRLEIGTACLDGPHELSGVHADCLELLQRVGHHVHLRAAGGAEEPVQLEVEEEEPGAGVHHGERVVIGVQYPVVAGKPGLAELHFQFRRLVGIRCVSVALDRVHLASS